MKKGQLLSVLLMGCIVVNTDVVVAATQSKSVNKTVTNSHKKNKTVQKTQTASQHHRQMTEKDIAECTTLINKVVQTDKTLQKDMVIKVSNDAKIADHLKKSADVQLFASDDPVAIAHLTGKTAALPIQPIIKQPINVAKVTPVPAAPKPVSKLAVPPKSVAKSSTPIPTNTQVFASDNPKAIANLTGKTIVPAAASTPKPSTKSTLKPPVTTAPKVATTKPTPHIELFAPNTPDLNHLEGKSANLSDIQKASSVDKSATAGQKTKNPATKTKKTASSTKTGTAATKKHS